MNGIFWFYDVPVGEYQIKLQGIDINIGTVKV